jgi:hypothetical protein
LRRATEEIATFRVVDGIRAGVVVRRRGRTRGAWTFDPVQARTITRLFELLWDEAEPEGDETG